MSSGFLIVGGGQAASSAAAKIRELDGDVPVTMICAEPVLPYQRPPLSKKYLSGEMPLQRLVLRPQEWFEEQAVKVRTGVKVSDVDREAKTVGLDTGERVSYDKLLLATGSRVRRLPAAIGGELEGVHYLRAAEDADGLSSCLKSGNRLLVVGGGYIGLEVSAIARQAGVHVTLVEMADRILQRVAAKETSTYFRDLHTQHGVRLLEGVGLDTLTSEGGKVVGAKLSDGSEISVDCVLCGIGIVPSCSLAEQTGLEIDNGIAVDAHCRTSDPNIFAAGDCASFEFHGKRIRLESVPNAIHQAEVAVENMLGRQQEYLATPWFWSDQYDVKLQIAGLNSDFSDTVVRPGKRPGSQSVWYFRDHQLIAVDAMNDAPSFMVARRIIESGGNIPIESVANSNTNLKDFT